ncbi:hypothetical protein ABOM_008987 [Aspergillus bombycis]|uniref:EF-hand domain-containing protein n=1 Tax=Aspergillus bombycis TaxID=109264 RepID=A0A1F7ZTM0_9EURO|nr:hypothetical protein ABOM_008987 [Aspergillus bombycis]OGM42804.1 hypothetical protein ABOM_008987 [Aspergillus bombycis]
MEISHFSKQSRIITSPSFFPHFSRIPLVLESFQGTTVIAMSWYETGRKSGYNEGFYAGREAALKELKNQEGIDQTKRACLDELLQRDPENIYYSSNVLRNFLADFYQADYDRDGHITLQELCERWRPNDEETYRKLEARFNEAEVTGDQKLTLAEFFIIGFLGDDRKNGYKSAKKVDS